ncbi:hypothetical protein [Pseudomonas cremoricolorata]|uniref:capsular polysaccharide export protein, LipB/KpsS family n=1 Tax=Pseudomonas cremoricolorata TaxID=157783 RepID=UPI0003FD1BD0|nr:hypothetical protein [Pseudomonas cremoricolorata]
MSSLNTLLSSPGSFFKSLKSKKEQSPTTYVVGFGTWKKYLRKYLPDRNLSFIDATISKQDFDANWKRKVFDNPNADLLVWSSNAPAFIVEEARKSGKAIAYVDEGFIRSVDIGAKKTPSLSLTFDRHSPYYDAQTASELEQVLSSHDFQADTALMQSATNALDSMLELGISKYNGVGEHEITALYGAKIRKRILVLGQVEDDANVRLGCTSAISNMDLIRLAHQENPDAQIIYKPHPDSARYKLQPSDEAEVEKISTVLKADTPLPPAFLDVDHVYTVTSLGGFEALLRGITVTTLGCAFYSGWGLTDDRQANPRRTRKLTALEVFAAAYILYSKYYDAEDGTPLKIEDALVKMAQARDAEKLALSEAKAKSSAAAARAIAKAPTGAATKPANDKPAAKAKAATPAKAPAKPAAKPAAKAPAKGPVKAPAKAPAKAPVKAPAKPVAKVAETAPAKPPVKPAAPAAAKALVPDWFNSYPGAELKAALSDSKPIFLYVPWIKGHGDALIQKVTNSEHYQFAPLDFIRGIDEQGVRQSVLRMTREDPALYRRMLINRLVPLRGKIKAVVFTFDWSAAMRIIADVCSELDIPRILIPHESVFVDREKYYWDITSKASVPSADLILGWGGMQREIFTERGYPDQLFKSVGAPKFDIYTSYQPALSRAQFCRLYGLKSDKRTILFATQPLDSQLDKKIALLSQRKAIIDLEAVTRKLGMQLLVRLPPNKEDILGGATRKVLSDAEHVAIDEGHCYLTSPEETLYHSDIITSINSTMLFEGRLMGRPALSIKYIDFDQIWEKAGIPAAKDVAALESYIIQFNDGTFTFTDEGMQWASNMFGIGTFDGQATSRIISELERVAEHGLVQRKPDALDRLFAKAPLDVVAIPSSAATLRTTQLHVQSMLRARTLISTTSKDVTIQNLASTEIFFQWGITENVGKSKQRAMAHTLARPTVYLEDGFIRSRDIGLAQEPGLSVILDDTTAYYDANKISRLSRLLENGPELTPAQLERSRNAIDLIVKERISKYNHAPDIPMLAGTPGRKKLLLVDQRFGDQSVASGLGSEEAFNRMIHEVCRERSDCDILVKQHPDAIKGGKSSYFSNEKLAFTQHMSNVYPILYDINPFALFDVVDEVYVMTSGMGFEALMAGKIVHCYGMPFYAGWGATADQQSLTSRTRRRTVEELFHFAYIESSRYFNPETNAAAEVEDVVRYIAAMKKK